MSRIAKHFKKEKLSGRRKVLRIIRNLIGIGILLLIIMMGYTAYRIGRINQDTLYSNIERSSIIYDMSGEEVDSLHYTEDRTIVKISEMPDNLKNAFIAIEDKTFYKHHGFNFRRMFGAVLSKLTGRSDAISGTSTITQQLARNAYLSEIKSQRSIRRKLSEMYIAWRLESNLSKDQILEAYLNTIYLGYGNYGVNAAARTYFSKEVQELDLAECAALAALPQAPDSYAFITTEEAEGAQEIKNIHYYARDEMDEEENKKDSENASENKGGEESATTEGEEAESGSGFYSNDISKERRDLVLSLMADQGYISESDAESAHVDIIDILEPSFEKSESAYTYFTDYVASVVMKDLMDKYEMSEEEAQRMVYAGGLQIHTTLNSEIQNIIYDEFKNDSNFPEAVDGSEVQASMVVTDVGTGRITALVGGRNTEGSQLFNRAISPRQPGSSIKPLSVYGAALQKSYEYAKKDQTFMFKDYGFDNQGTKYWGDYITASSGVIDEPLEINGEEWPQNFTKRYSGGNTLRTALQQSLNTCAVKIVWQVGLDYAAEMLQKYGLTTVVTDENENPNDVNPAAMALGAMTYGVSPLEMALAYAAFPGGGKVNTAMCYTEIYDGNGKTILSGKSESTQVMDKGVAWIMTDLLKSVVSEGIAKNASISGVEVGGKTGTTNDTYDVWFDGFTPRYAAALWIGTDLNVEMKGTSAQAAALWSKIMGQVSGITDDEYADMPANVIKHNGEFYSLGTEKNAGSRYAYSKKKDSDDKKDKDKKKDKEDEEDEEDDEDEEESDGGSQPPVDNNSGTGAGGNSGGSSGGDAGGSSGNTGGSGGDSGGNTGGSGGDSGGSTGGSGGDSGGNTGGSGGNSGGNSGGSGGNSGGNTGGSGGDSGGNTGGSGGDSSGGS